MKIVTNTRKIERNVKITKYATFGSLLVLGVGIYFSLTQQDRPGTVYITFSALIIGFILSQLSIFMQNHWGKSPRPDELIIAQLKGLDDKHTLYIYKTPIPFLLVSPNGIWGILTYHQEGKISFENDRYHHKGGNAIRKLFGGDGLGRPDLDQQNLVSSFQRWFAKNITGFDMPKINVVLVFTSPKVDLELDDSPIPAIHSKKLKDLIRKKAFINSIPIELIEQINQRIS